MFHDNPLVDATLMRIDALAKQYRLEHEAQTEKEDGDFLTWKKDQPELSKEDIANLDDELAFSKLAGYVWDDASPSELLYLVGVIDEIRDSINRQIRRGY